MVTGFALQALSPQLDLQNKTEHHAWIHCALPALPISRAFMRSLSMHTLSPELHTAAVLYQPCCIHFSSLSRRGHAQNQKCGWNLCWGLHQTPLKLAYVLPGLVIPLRVHEKLLMEPVTF